MARKLRYTVEPRDVSPEKAARRLGLDLDQFRDVLPRLLSRGFPSADPDTGNFDLDAIDEWRRRRHRNLYGEGSLLGVEPPARDVSQLIAERVSRMQFERKTR